MPRGSKPGERRGGRQRGTPNKATVAKAAALASASADPTVTPLQFLLGVMRDPKAPTGLRVQVARAAAPLVHGKPGTASVEDRAGNASGVGGPDGSLSILRKQRHFGTWNIASQYFYENGTGRVKTVVPSRLPKLWRNPNSKHSITKGRPNLVCPPGYGPGATTHNRLWQLHNKRLTPPSCGGGELKGVEDEEEAFLTVRVAAFRHSQKGRDWERITELEVYRVHRSDDEQAELDELRIKYPKSPSDDSELASAIRLRLAELRNRTK